MKKLKEILHRITSLQKELAEFGRLEDKTRADILSVARSDVPLDVQKQRIRDARLTLDLVDAKRGKILEPRDQAMNELGTLLRNQVATWNSAVSKGQEAIEDHVVESTLGFFEGDERACRRWWDRGNMGQLPIFHEFRQSFYPTESLSGQIGRDAVGTARDFLNFAERHCAVMKIDASTLGIIMLRRTIHPQVRVLDEKQGIVEYVASDESLDSYNEIIRADGWRFDEFQKNSPFVDSHNYSSINSLLGKVVDFSVQGKRLVETVQWAVDVSENALAQLGFKMTAAGYLKAVSVGFMPVRMATPYDRDADGWRQTCESMGIDPTKTDCRCVYLEHQQKELSTCVIGANPNALARSYAEGILTDSSIHHIARHFPEFANAVERAIKPVRRTSFMPGNASTNAVAEMMQALGAETKTADINPQPQSTMKTTDSLKDFSRLTIVSKGAFESIESARNGQNETEIERSVRTAFASLAREQHAAYGNPVERYLNADPERRFFWNGMARRMANRGMKVNSPEYKAVQKAVSGINMQQSFGAGMLQAIPVAGDIYDLLLDYGQYKMLGLRKMVGQYTRFAEVTGYPSAIFITPSQQGQTTIPTDMSLAGTQVTPQANTIAALVEASIAWLADETVDLSAVLLSQFIQGLAARIDYGCFQGNGNDDINNGMTTGLFTASNVAVYQAPAGESTINSLTRSDFINVTAQVAPAALQQMEQQPPRWYIHPALIPQLLQLKDGTGPHYLLKTPAETQDEWLLVGFPVTWAAQAPTASTAGSTFAVFGNPDAYLVGLHEQFEIAMSDSSQAFADASVHFRALGRGRSFMRDATGFVQMQLSAA